MSRRRRHRPSAVLAAAVKVEFVHRDVKPEKIDLEAERATWIALWSTP